MRGSRYVPLALVFGVGAALAGCDRAPATEPDYSPVAVRLLSSCAVQPAVSVSGVAGVAGAVLQGGGVSVVIPAGALAGSTTFSVEVPSSQYAEVEIRANGQDHFQFLLPVTIAIDYGGCNTPSGSLSAWHIDPDTKQLLENMGGVDDKANRRVIFSTMHLSGYAIAN